MINHPKAQVKGHKEVASFSLDVDFTKFLPGSFVRNGHSDDLLTTTLGAVAILATWGTWIGGITSPFWVAYLYLRGAYGLFTLSILGLGWGFVFTPKPWPHFVRFILKMGGWFSGGTSLTAEANLKGIDPNGPNILAMHPHGIFCHGFILNGAARIHARDPPVYLPPNYQDLSTKCTGVVEPLLFKIPLIRSFLLWFNCAEPATKETMHGILARKVPFGILPGGSEGRTNTNHGHALPLLSVGQENVYIKNRAGFIKYALQHGYTIVVGYSFGESDLYHTCGWFKAARLGLMHKTGLMLFLAWGTWWCPLLPIRDKPINTVIGNPIFLPKIPNPTAADIKKYHDIYIEKLVDLFERNKARFGYNDRSLNIY